MTDRTSNRRNRPPRKLRTIDEYAELWQVSPRTVRRKIKSGALRTHRIGRLLRISDDDADDFLDSNHDN
jgi:excisionase family DNA binding protein